MNYKDIIAKTIQKQAPTAINVHPVENHFIMEINYVPIVDAIVEDLEANGYTITTQQ